MVLITIETLIFKHEIPAFKNLQIPIRFTGKFYYM